MSGQFLNTSFAGPRYVRVPATAGPAAAAPGSGSSSSSSSSASPSTWWQLDLGPQHRLLCNYYVIRHDGSQEGYARSWCLQVGAVRQSCGQHTAGSVSGQQLQSVSYCIHSRASSTCLFTEWLCLLLLQGSNDLQHWLDLRRHADDTTIRLPGQYGSWPVSGPAACMPFRAFRLLLTGPTQVCVCVLMMRSCLGQLPRVHVRGCSQVPAGLG